MIMCATPCVKGRATPVVLERFVKTGYGSTYLPKVLGNAIEAGGFSVNGVWSRVR